MAEGGLFVVCGHGDEAVNHVGTLVGRSWREDHGGQRHEECNEGEEISHLGLLSQSCKEKRRKKSDQKEE